MPGCGGYNGCKVLLHGIAGGWIDRMDGDRPGRGDRVVKVRRMPLSWLLLACLCSPLLPGQARGETGNGGDILKQRCASCHALHGPAPQTVAELWKRKAPDLFYAGDKYRREWVERWLQQPRRIRPAGEFYRQHIKPGKVRDLVDESTLKPHPRLDRDEAIAVAKALADMHAHRALIEAEQLDAKLDPGAFGETLFITIYGCMACHRIEPGYGGLSGPELYTAGLRLQPRFMLSYIRSPQAWDPKIWMPNKHVPEVNIQKLVHYLIDLSKGDGDAAR